MAEFFIQGAFNAGEIGPSLWGQVALAKFHSAATTARNMFVSYRGGLYSRAGTAFVAYSKQIPPLPPPRLIKFQFNINQGYALEFGEHYMRVYSDGAPIVENATTITGVTNANPGVVTDPAHGCVNGDWIEIANVQGMTQLNGNTYIVAGATTNTFTLRDIFGNAINTTAFGVYTTGGTAARVFTLVTPYAAADLDYLKYTESADVMSLTLVNQITGTEYPPYDLARITASNWTLTQSTFASAIAAPAATSGVPTVQPDPLLTPPTLPTAYAYVITAVSRKGEESVASPRIDITDSVDIASTAGSEILIWSPVTDAFTYNIYKAPPSYNTDPGNPTDALPVPAGSLFGYIGTSYGNQFVDSNIVQDLSQVPPRHQNPFARGAVLAIIETATGTGYTFATVAITTGTGSGFEGEAVIQPGGAIVAVIVVNAGHGYLDTDTVVITGDGTGATADISVGPQTGTYPGVVSYFQQRRAYAFTLNQPDTYFLSQPGKFLNFDDSIPPIDTDAITGTPWAQQVNGIQFMLPMPGGLVVFTGLGAWLLGGAGGGPSAPQPLTPTSQQATQQAFNGCSATVSPTGILQDILYVQAKNSIVRDLQYNFWTNIYTGSDLTQLSGQLFTGYTIVQSAWTEEPYKVLWYARNDGIMLSLTYVKDQEVFGWARHDTQGLVKDMCAVTEPPVDALYLTIYRGTQPTGGNPLYFIERMNDRLWQTSEDPWCVDCGLAYPMPTPNAALAASSVTGAVTFVATLPVFAPGDVAKVIRASGGIATITGYVSATELTGTWNLGPATNTDALLVSFVPQSPGAWTLTPQVSVVTGLNHLKGLLVTGLADGIPIPLTIVAADGSVTLPRPASNIKIGLAFQAQVQSVYLDVGGQGTVQGRRKTITGTTVRVEASAGIKGGSSQPDGSAQVPPTVNPAWSNLVVVPDQGATYTSPGGGTVTKLFTGDLRANLVPNWAKPGQVALQQDNPLPMQIVDVVLEFLEGDTPEVTYAPRQQGGGDAKRAPRGPGAWMLRE